MAIKVLIVDDDPAVNKSLVNFLEDFDFDPASVLSAEDALDLARSQLFEVGIIDLRLPKMDGDQLILELHKIQPDLKYLIHTGSTEFILTDELMSLGIEQQHILNKPLPDMNVIVDFIQQLTQ